MALVNPNIALSVQQFQVPNMLGMAAEAEDIQNMQVNRQAALQEMDRAQYSHAIAQSKEALRFVQTPDQYLAWMDSSFNDPVVGKMLKQMGVDPAQSRAQVMAELQQPGGFERAIQRSTASVAELGNIMGQRVNAIEAQRQAQADRAAAAREQAVIQGIISGQGMPTGANALATGGGAPAAPVNALAAPPSAPADASIMTPEATAAAPVAPAAVPTMSEVVAQPPTQADQLLNTISQLRQAAAAGVKGAATAADQLQKQYDLEVKQNPVLSAADRFVPVGGNIFDRQNAQFIKPPTPDEIEQIKPTLEKGEIYNAETQRVELVPGSTRYNKRRDEHTKSLQVVKGIEDKVGNGVKRLDEILDPRNRDALEGNFGGYNAYATRLLSGPNSDMRVKLDEFKSDMASAGLELIRQGGSIGQMTEKEWPIVSGLIGQLDPVLGETEAIRMMEEIKARFDRIINNANELYDEQWSGTQFYKERKNDQTGAGASVTVTTPNGQTFTFSSQSAADKFKQKAGIQ